MRVLVTGAEGFAGGWMVPALLAAGHEVGGTHRPGHGPPGHLPDGDRVRVTWLAMDLRDRASVETGVGARWDAVIHLAGIASGADARRDPGLAWEVNAAGTARVAEALATRRLEEGQDPLLLLASTAEVYGAGAGAPHPETDPLLPCSPYAASKLGAEVAAHEVARRTGLRVVVARPFPHTGPGQETRYVVPALASRIRMAKRVGAPAINTGDLEPVRDFLDVRDVVEAYRLLLERGQPGETYNIAGGQGVALREVLDRLQALVGVRVIAEHEPSLARRADIPHLVGDATKLRDATGWSPRVPLDQTLRDLLDAQAD